MAKPLADKKPPYGGGYMGDPYGAYGGGGPAYNQVSQLKQTFRCSEHISAKL
jgi:hypothetical protein